MKKEKKPVKIITLDTETYNGLIGKLKRIAIYDGHEITYGYTLDDVYPVITRYNTVGYEVHCYIHNMEFDLRKLPSLFEKGNVDWKQSLLINNRIATLKTVYCTYHDSFKLLPSALSKLSKDFDVEHGKLDLWDAIVERYGKEAYKDVVDFLDRCDPDNELYLEYLGYDVMSLYEVIQKLRHVMKRTEEEFVHRPSTASLSRTVFKEGIGDVKFKDPKLLKSDYEMMTQYKWKSKKDREIEEFIRLSYCGGRCEVFYPRLTLNPLYIHGYHFDVNSLYPYVMHEHEFPVGKPIFTDSAFKAQQYYEDWERTGEGMGFINARVYIPMQEIPPLPVKMGKLTFPCGHVYGTWTYHELQYAVKECGVVIEEFYACCHFVQTFPVFRRFVDYFYKMKAQATIEKKEALRTFSKLMQNTGYGYTGMKREKSQLDDIENYPKYLSKGKEIKGMNEEYGFIEVPKDMTADYIQVQIASYVTSFARLVWLKGARTILSYGGKVFYGDTDSLVSNIPLPQELVDATRLGAWDLEGEPVDGIFLKPKVYTEFLGNKYIRNKDGELVKNTDYNVKFKGVSKGKVINSEEQLQDLDFGYYEDIYKHILTGDKEYLIEKERLVLRSIKYMEEKELDLETYHEYRDKKMYLQRPDKRIIDYVNNTSKPLYFNTIEDFETFSYTDFKDKVEYDCTAPSV